MKTVFFWRIVAIAMFAVVCGTLVSCDKDESTPPTPGLTEELKGEVSFSINFGGNSSGNGSSSSPATVQQGDTLNMAISQISKYTDPDGSVYTCEPKAAIKLSTPNDTLYVKDFQTLTTVIEKSNVASQSNAGEKQTKKMLQTFDVGGKEVVFDVAYDIFSHVNSLQQRIEMPYIKVNAAQYGAAQPEKADTRAETPSVSVTGMRIVPHAPQTRGIIVDSTMYDVNVAFNVAVESVHTKKEQNQTLSFEVSFLAVVEDITEYPDPEMQFNYELHILGGTKSTASPFVLTPGEKLSLEWAETCRYTYFSLKDFTSQTILREPKVSVNLEATKDTIWVANKEELEKLAASDVSISQDGTNPLVTSGHKVFSMADQAITLNWSYDAYEDVDVEGTSVAMPHLELGEPQIVSVSATELTNASVPGKQAKVYAVEVRLSQELKSVNDAKESTESIEYVVKFIGAIDVKLVKVVYRKDWVWVDSHDNMLLAYYPMVHRDRIYSTGETFTDTFRDLGHLADRYIPLSIGGEPIQEVSDGVLVRTAWKGDTRDSIIICPFSASVPNLDKVFDVLEYEGDEPLSQYITPPPGTWDEYETGKRYTDLDISLDGVEVVGANGVSDLPSGWYFYRPDYVYNNFVCIYGDEFRLLQGEMHICFYDQFLVIDGRMITFLEYRGPMDFKYRKENITMPNGAPGFVYTTEFRRKFLEKNFYFCRIDSIYQQKP